MYQLVDKYTIALGLLLSITVFVLFGMRTTAYANDDYEAKLLYEQLKAAEEWNQACSINFGGVIHDVHVQIRSIQAIQSVELQLAQTAEQRVAVRQAYLTCIKSKLSKVEILHESRSRGGEPALYQKLLFLTKVAEHDLEMAKAHSKSP